MSAALLLAITCYVVCGLAMMASIHGPESSARLRWPVPPLLLERAVVVASWPFILLWMVIGPR